MTSTKPAYYNDLEQCVQALLDKVGNKVVIAGGFGRPVHIFNELYRRAAAGPGDRADNYHRGVFQSPPGQQ